MLLCSTYRLPLLLSTAIVLLSATVCTIAESDESEPGLSGEISFELESDSVLDSDDRDAELTDTYATVEPTLMLRFNPNWSLNAGLVLEPVLDPDPGKNRFFEDHGLYAEQLFVQYNDAWGRIYAGKFNPSFGIARDLAPGIFGTDFADDYELAERVGAGAALVFGNNTMTLNAFTTDRSKLSDSLFTERGRLRKDDAGRGNTNGLESFTVTLGGDEFMAMPGLSYHLGLSYQAGGDGDPGNERGLVAGLFKTIDMSDDRALDLIAELALFDDYAASTADARYLTVGADYRFEPWHIALASNLRRINSDIGAENEDDEEVEDTGDIHDWLVQISVGYSFDFGLSVDLGYRAADESDDRNDTLGTLAAYTVEF